MTTVTIGGEGTAARKPVDWWRWGGRLFLVFLLGFTVMPMAWMLITSL